MPLTIKDLETDRLARRLASLTGESLTETVANSLRERLEKIQRDQSVEARKAAVRRIANRFRQQGHSGLTSLDHGDLLYDEHGLPR
jgi:antitoxin VapB